MAYISRKKMQDWKAFVASCIYGAEKELMSYKDAEYAMEEWRKQGEEIPEGLTPYYFSKIWNEFMEGENQ